MPNYNHVALMGNVTRDPEIRYTPSGKAVAEIGLAINEYGKDAQGNRTESTVFVDITLWGRTAEIAGEYLKKGNSAFIEGRLQLDTWDDKQSGQKRSKLKVVGENLQLMGSKQGGEQGGQRSNPAPQGYDEGPSTSMARAMRNAGRKPAPPPRPPADPDLDSGEDDIPF